ncbi:MAG: extracellular solute-binding protein [Simkaniaceae bacterium]|nr:extracellular solute-binding protein [Simkaniaceae bacterium]
MISRVTIILFWILLIFGIIFFERDEPSAEKSITVFTFAQMFDPEIITAFEKKTGIKVNLTYYDSNEELLVKLKASRGEGYDLIIPSDYAVALLREEGLLKKLDKSKLYFIDRIMPNLKGLPYDPENEHSLPFQWDIYGFGMNKELLPPGLPMTWDAVFKNQGYPIIMSRDPIDTLNFASRYLFGHNDPLVKHEIKEIRSLLIKQKEWVQAYAALRGDFFLATRSVPLCLSISSYVFSTMKDFPFISFELPEEWTFISVENVAIPKPSDKEDLVYEFLNAMYEEETLAKCCDKLLFYPAIHGVISHMENKPAAFERILEESTSRTLYFCKPIVSEERARTLWIEVKGTSY